MIAILSPAKTLDYSSQSLVSRKTMPAFLKDSEELIAVARMLSKKELGRLMGISEKLAELNHERFQSWIAPFPKGEAKQALLAFKGDVYQGFEFDLFEKKDWDFAQEHLRILSGLYGLLRPLDLMLPYRLEMGTKLGTKRGKDLYTFWGASLTEALNAALKKQGDDVLVNLASNEYFGAVRPKALKGQIITPVFKDTKKGKVKIISFFAKRARGMMADFIIRNGLSKVEDLKAFNVADYAFEAALSSEDTFVFTRGER
ncbi:MAG: cytoplasmic iron level regulating protein YaaA (DUF328/UPF0246 family) [Verrucomicrobiales bacterium]|jgi:cytoplasmic iron level regulating protein YaaA (DUF328/UPF0246 family)